MFHDEPSFVREAQHYVLNAVQDGLQEGTVLYSSQAGKGEQNWFKAESDITINQGYSDPISSGLAIGKNWEKRERNEIWANE